MGPHFLIHPRRAITWYNSLVVSITLDWRASSFPFWWSTFNWPLGGWHQQSVEHPLKTWFSDEKSGTWSSEFGCMSMTSETVFFCCFSHRFSIVSMCSIAMFVSKCNPHLRWFHPELLLLQPDKTPQLWCCRCIRRLPATLMKTLVRRISSTAAGMMT